MAPRLSPGTGDAPAAPHGPATGRPTIKDVAARAGVGWKTVSRALNGERGVSAATSDQVLAAARELGYRPHRGASDLRRSDQRTATVGLLLQDLGNPYSAQVLRAVEDAGRPLGVSVVAASLEGDPQRQREAVEMMVARRVDGLLIAPVGAALEHLEREMAQGLHAVLVDQAPAGSTADAVVVDNLDGARAAVEQFLALGHRRIAYLGDHAGLTTAQLRHEGYRAALAAAGVAPLPALEHPSVSGEAEARAAVAVMLAGPTPPTAVLAAQNVLSMGAVRALAAAGARHRVALIGFDDFPLADLLSPAVTVVAQDVTEVGTRAAACLFERIGGHGGPPRRTVVPTRLVRRGSGEIPAPGAAAVEGGPAGTPRGGCP